MFGPEIGLKEIFAKKLGGTTVVYLFYEMPK